MTSLPSSSPNTVLPRRVILYKENSWQQKGDPRPISDFRDAHAWVLLGEPGAGKTIAFKEEAKLPGCNYLHLEDFIDLSVDESWKNVTLFLDGLDEVRARDGHGALGKVRQRLSELGTPRFRIACRAADWHEATDHDALNRLSPGGLEELILEPLKPDEIYQILRENHGIQDAEAFVENLKAIGLQDLLGNPLTLELFAKAHSEGKAPRSKEEAYRLGCEFLSQEKNPEHQQAHKNEPCSVERMLDAAGQLLAVILLADLHGIALTDSAKDKRFASIAEINAKDVLAAKRVLDSRLFRSQSPDRIVPIHRSVAEYLGARWLAKHIDESKIPCCRILGLLTGHDGRPIGSLRGLFGWLATLSGRSRTQMIQADPVAILAYGDVKIFIPKNKRAILTALRKEADLNPAFDWDYRVDPIFAPLADKGLIEDLRSILEDTDRGQAHQIHARCVLRALENGEPLPELLPVLWVFAEDTSHWPYNRKLALRIGLTWESDSMRALAVLKKIQNGAWDDPDDDFLTTLLDGLYPDHLGVEKLLDQIHPPKNTNLIGNYVWFLRYELPKKMPADQVAICLDELTKRSGQASWISENRLLLDFATAVLLRGLQEHGDSIEVARLLRWFSLHNFGQISCNQTESYRKALEWLGLKSERYKKLLTAVFDFCRSQSDPVKACREWNWRLNGAPIPSDLGSWHLTQAGDEPNKELAQLRLQLAFDALCWDRGAEGLSLEAFFEWSKGNDQRQGWLKPLLSVEIPNWHWDQLQRNQKYKLEQEKRLEEQSSYLSEVLPQIRNGTAPAELMANLEAVWSGHCTGITGQTPEERFQSLCLNGNEVLSAAEEGFQRCVERKNLPLHSEILTKWFANKRFVIQDPCLRGMEFRWQKNGRPSLELDGEVLRRLIAFATFKQGPPDWLKELAVIKPEFVAGVFIDSIQTGWKHGNKNVMWLKWLNEEREYFTKVAKYILPHLLSEFPTNGGSNSFEQLESLLKAAVLHIKDLLPGLCGTYLDANGQVIERREQVLWLTAKDLLSTTKDLSPYWASLGNQQSDLMVAGKFLLFLLGHKALSISTAVACLGGFAERLAVYSSFADNWGSDRTEADECRGLAQAFIKHLGAFEGGEGLAELERLIPLPTMGTFEFHLKQTLAQQRENLREAGYQKMDTAKIVGILSSGEPASREDLLDLVLDHLEDIASELHDENDNGFRAFWNIEDRQPQERREENLCRDQLLTRLRYRLLPLKVECVPEFNYAKEKRADIRVSYNTEFAIPIEIKKDVNPDLWTALHGQLIPQYTQDKMAQGHGIYLVLWFGDGGMKADPVDNQKASSIGDLQKRLEAQLQLHDKGRVVVRVIDVSWPPKEKVSKPAKNRPNKKRQSAKATTKKNPKARRDPV